MSERSNVSIAEILGDNYYIDKLTSNDYSPSVGDTVTITLMVKDVFGDPVTGQTRTVTCTGGQFVSMDGTSITASSSVDVTTGSGGTVTLGLSVSVVDNIVVSDGRCDCVVSSLSTSITNKVDTIYSTTATCNSNLAFTSTTTVNFRRIGNIVIADLWNAECKPTSTGWRNFVGIPSGYRPVSDIFIAVTSNATQIQQASTISGRTSIRAYVSAVPTSNISFGFLGVWATSDDYPSQ